MHVIRMAQPQLAEDEIGAAVEVLRSGQLRQGEVTAALEQAFADYVGSPHAYATSSGTAALHLAYLSLIAEGDEVLVPATTFYATASTVALAGGIPVFCDVDPQTFTIDLDDAAQRITSKTRALTAVYLFGQPIDRGSLADFAEKHGLVLIGDAAQALGTKWEDEHCGTEAVGCVHSFYPTKNLFVGEGGMVTTDDPQLDRRGRLLRSHGEDTKYRHVALGLNYRLTDVEAAIGLAQLPKVEGRNERRRDIAAAYDDEFADLDGLRTPFVPEAGKHTYHAYTVVVESGREARDSLAAALKERGVSSQVNYPVPLHRQPAFDERFHSASTALPQAEWLSQRVLSLPVHHFLSDADIERVIAAVKTSWKDGVGGSVASFQ